MWGVRASPCVSVVAISSFIFFFFFLFFMAGVFVVCFVFYSLVLCTVCPCGTSSHVHDTITRPQPNPPPSSASITWCMTPVRFSSCIPALPHSFGEHALASPSCAAATFPSPGVLHVARGTRARPFSGCVSNRARRPERRAACWCCSRR